MFSNPSLFFWLNRCCLVDNHLSIWSQVQSIKLHIHWPAYALFIQLAVFKNTIWIKKLLVVGFEPGLTGRLSPAFWTWILWLNDLFRATLTNRLSTRHNFIQNWILHSFSATFTKYISSMMNLEHILILCYFGLIYVLWSISTCLQIRAENREFDRTMPQIYYGPLNRDSAYAWESISRTFSGCASSPILIYLIF